MKMKFSEKGARALVKLRTNDDFQAVLQDFSSNLNTAVEQMMYADEDKRDTARGYARCITEFFNSVESASSTVEQFDQTRKTR